MSDPDKTARDYLENWRTDLEKMQAMQDRIAELEARLAQYEGWQPIETAPKDGKLILLHHRGKGRTADGAWSGGIYNVWAWPYVMLEPTHWMPMLPAIYDAGDE